MNISGSSLPVSIRLDTDLTKGCVYANNVSESNNCYITVPVADAAALATQHPTEINHWWQMRHVLCCYHRYYNRDAHLNYITLMFVGDKCGHDYKLFESTITITLD